MVEVNDRIVDNAPHRPLTDRSPALRCRCDGANIHIRDLMASRQNRVDPSGDLRRATGRGLLTGNRGCLVDTTGEVVRYQRGALWISCVTEWRGRRQPLAAVGRWTPLFFLDEAVALAAGHRPCAYCRRFAYNSYVEAIRASDGDGRRLNATALNRRLAGERSSSPGAPSAARPGLARGEARQTWPAELSTLPTGTVFIEDAGTAMLVTDDHVAAFSFDGWSHRALRPEAGVVQVLTPPTSVAALRHGYVPLLHPSTRTPPAS